MKRTRIADTTRPLILDLGCCGASALQIGAPRYSLPHFDPPQANVLIVAGRIAPQTTPLVQTLYQQLSPPRWVIAYGVCAISGAVFDTLELEQIIPVDYWIPGCPPHTDELHSCLANLPRRRK